MSKINKEKFKKVMVFGTFDGLHMGHIDFFKQARNLAKNPILIVSIARDINVKKIKGLEPLIKESKRRELLAQCALVDKVVLGGKSEYLTHILKENPDIIALGYDQKAYVQNLTQDFKKNRLKAKIVRLKPYKEHIYKNHLLKQKIKYNKERSG